MTGLPSLPTDNLYKFCALSGLVIVFAVTYASWQKWEKLKGDEAWFPKESERMDFDKLWDKLMQDTRKEVLRTWDQGEPNGKPIMLDGVPIPRDQFWKYYLQREEQGRKRFEEIAVKADAWERAEGELRLLEWATGIGITIGAALTVYGFRNWRILQLKQDKLIDRELSHRA